MVFLWVLNVFCIFRWLEYTACFLLLQLNFTLFSLILFTEFLLNWNINIVLAETLYGIGLKMTGEKLWKKIAKCCLLSVSYGLSLFHPVLSIYQGKIFLE